MSTAFPNAMIVSANAGAQEEELSSIKDGHASALLVHHGWWFRRGEALGPHTCRSHPAPTANTPAS